MIAFAFVLAWICTDSFLLAFALVFMNSSYLAVLQDCGKCSFETWQVFWLFQVLSERGIRNGVVA